MKTDILNGPKGIRIESIPLDGFIVKETLAPEALVRGTRKQTEKTVFTAADLWNIHRNGRRYGGRR